MMAGPEQESQHQQNYAQDTHDVLDDYVCDFHYGFRIARPAADCRLGSV
jgi:hypothetical protein